jgi:hypothetical protein
MKKIIGILTILGAVIDTVFKLNLLQELGVTGIYVGYVKLAGMIISATLMYYSPAPKKS